MAGKKLVRKHSSKARSRRRTTGGKVAGTCFVIMPFGGWFDRYWEQIYQPAIENADLEPQRADDIFRPGSIMHDIWLCTRKADVLLADLSGRNSNVFYELGLAHAIGKPVVLVSESIDDVPFDLQGLRVVLYDKREPKWGVRLSESITTALRETIAEPNAAIPTTFVEERSNTEQPTLSGADLEILQLRQDVEQLKRQMAHGGLDLSYPVWPRRAGIDLTRSQFGEYPVAEDFPWTQYLPILVKAEPKNEK